MTIPTSWPNPYTHAPRDYLPPGCVMAHPTPDESRCWMQALIDCNDALELWSLPVHAIWFAGADVDYHALTLAVPGRQTVVLLRSGRRLTDLRRTIVHELRHVRQVRHAPDWSVADREADADAFVIEMLGR